MLTELMVKCFLSAANNANMTRAAELLYMERQSVSKQIKKLEENLRTVLFERNHNELVLTEPGKLYFNFFTRAEVELQKIGRIIEENNDQPAFRVAIPLNVNMNHFLKQLKDFFTEDHVNAKLKWEQHSRVNTISLFKMHYFDLVISFSSLYESFDFPVEKMLLCEVPLYVCVGESNPKSSTAKSPEDLTDEPVFTWKVSSNTSRYENWGSFGDPRRITILPNEDSVQSMVELGEGVAICNAIDKIWYAPGLKKIPMNKGEKVYCNWWKDSTSPVLQQVIKKLKESSLTVYSTGNT